jgi:hypothetical protein
MRSDLGEESGINLLASRFETTACTTPERVNPRIKGQRISQPIAAAM